MNLSLANESVDRAKYIRCFSVLFLVFSNTSLHFEERRLCKIFFNEEYYQTYSDPTFDWS